MGEVAGGEEAGEGEVALGDLEVVIVVGEDAAGFPDPEGEPVVGGPDEGVAPGGLGEGAVHGGDDGATGGHGFQGGEAAGFGEGVGVGEEAAGAGALLELFLADGAHDGDAGEGGGLGEEGVFFGGIGLVVDGGGAVEEELGLGDGAADVGPGAQQHGEAATGVGGVVGAGRAWKRTEGFGDGFAGEAVEAEEGFGSGQVEFVPPAVALVARDDGDAVAGGVEAGGEGGVLEGEDEGLVAIVVSPVVAEAGGDGAIEEGAPFAAGDEDVGAGSGQGGGIGLDTGLMAELAEGFGQTEDGGFAAAEGVVVDVAGLGDAVAVVGGDVEEDIEGHRTGGRLNGLCRFCGVDAYRKAVLSDDFRAMGFLSDRSQISVAVAINQLLFLITPMSTIITKDGTQIYYKDWGTGTPVVFSHGWPLCGDAWESQMVFLASHGYRCIAHDRRGHGRSSQPWQGNEMNTYADDLAELLTALDLKGATLVGHSTGGGEVARYIGRHGTGRVAKAVLVGAVPPLMLKTEANPGGLPLAVFDGIRAGSLADRSQFYKDLAGGPFFGFNRPGAKVSQGMIDAFWMQGMMAGHKNTLDCIKAFSETDFTEDLKKFDVPTLIIHGDDDQIVPIGAAALLSAKLVKGAVLKVYAGAAHGLTDTCKERLNADLLEFVRG